MATSALRTGLASALLRPQAFVTPFGIGIVPFSAHAYLNQGAMAMRQPLRLEQARVQIAAAPREEARAPVQSEAASKPASTALVVRETKPAKTADTKPAKTADVEPKKSLFQTLTQRKVLIVAGVILGVAVLGGAAAAAYYFYPVATTAHAMMVGHAGRVVALNTHQLLIRPGFTNTLIMAKMAKAAIVPVAAASGKVILPALSTVIVSTLGAFGLLCAANKAWKLAKSAMWGAGTTVANKFDEQLTQTGLGRGAKWILGPAVSTIASPIVSAFAPTDTTPGEPEFDDEDSVSEDVALQPRLLIKGSDNRDPKIEVADEAEAARVEKGRKNKNSLKARARKAQAKTESTWTQSIISHGLLLAALGGGVYWYTKGNQA